MEDDVIYYNELSRVSSGGSSPGYSSVGNRVDPGSRQVGSVSREYQQMYNLGLEFQGTEFWEEFLTIFRAYQDGIQLANESYFFPQKAAQARAEVTATFYDSLAALQQAARVRAQSSIAGQTAEQIAAGYNPLLNGVDQGAAATGGASIDTMTPASVANMPDVTTPLDIAGFASQVLGFFISSGISISSLAIKAGESAARCLLMEKQSGMLETAQASYAQSIAEQYVIDNAPAFDEGIGAFPAWVPASVPGLPAHLQDQGISFARAFYGSDRHRAGQIFTVSDVESGRAELANLYGSAFYSNSLGVMSDTVSKYAKLKLSVDESYYSLNLRYNDLYDKYFELLSPEAMADAQNAVLRYKAGYYNHLDSHQIAAAENAAAESSESFYNSYDSSEAAASLNAQNKYGSSLYTSLDASSKSAYENYYNELMVLSGEIENVELNSQKVLFDNLSRDLNSADPSVRVSAAKSVQRMQARIAARSSRTGWQRFSSGARTVVGAGVAIGGIGLAAAGAVPAAVGVTGAAGGAGLMYSAGDTAFGAGGLTGF